MLVDQIGFVASLLGQRRTGELCMAGAWPSDRPQPPALATLAHTVQGEGDLGHRLDRAFARGHASGSQRIAVLGSDAPTLPESLVDEAFERLRNGAQAVITPARDGGYVLIATGGRFPALFRDIPWGTDGVLTATRQRARDAGIALEETPSWFDVDRIEDLRPLLAETDAAPQRAPATAQMAATLRLYVPDRPVV
jgi:glycosyltransferase A (GT-A) superfamily protein (DUF2064 family)